MPSTNRTSSSSRLPSQPSHNDFRTLTEAKALSALAHPVRSRLMDALKVDGPSTASALAARISQNVGNVSHHLKVLSEGGLVVEAPELAKDRRERWWRLVNAGTRWTKADLADDPAAVAAAEAAEALHLHRQIARVHEWMAHAEEKPGWEDVAFATQFWLRLSQDELRELSEQLTELLAQWGRRDIPDDGVERESVLVFARGFPSKP